MKQKGTKEEKDQKSESEVDLKNMDEIKEKARQGMRKKATKKTIDDYLYHIVIGVFLLCCLTTFLQHYYKDRRQLHEIPAIENKIITSHNSYRDSSYEIQENDFFIDWTLLDVKNILKGQLNNNKDIQKCESKDQKLQEIPNRYNFREEYESCLSSIMESKNCSSSHILSTLGVIQDRFCKLTGEKVKLSGQQILNCDEKGQGCTGGSVSGVLDYLMNNVIQSENCIAYQGEQQECIKKDQCEGQYDKIVSGYCQVNKEDNIKRELINNGPVIVNVQVYRDFLLYNKGIYKPVEGTQKYKSEKHLMKLVGWDVDDKKREFWILENNWGNTWGEEGMARLYIGFKEFNIEDLVIAPIINPIYVSNLNTIQQ